MKAMPLAELQSRSAEAEAPNTMMQADVESGGGASTQYTQAGPKPPPSAAFNETPAKSPSDQAFEDADPHGAAKKYNAEHPEHVAKFNEATDSSCAGEGGELDVARVLAFQHAHGVTADGMVGPHTVAAAHHAKKKTVGTPSPEGKAMAMQMFEEVNGPPGQPAPAAAASAPKTVGTVSPEDRAEVMQMFEEVNGPPGQPAPAAAASAPKTVGTPSPEGRAMAMELFEEVNGGPGEESPTTENGAPKRKS